MKRPRLIKGAVALVAVLSLTVLSVAVASKRIGYAQDDKQKGNRSARSVTHRPDRKKLKPSGALVDINLPNFGEGVEWVVAASPLKDNEQEEVDVSVIGWADSGASKERRIERIDSIENYPSDLIEVTPGVVSIKGSEALGSNVSVVVFLKVKPEAQLRLFQDGVFVADSKPSFPQKGFAVKSGLSIAFPISGIDSIMTYLQADRVTRTFGKSVEEVIANEKK